MLSARVADSVDDLSPPHGVITADDHGGYVVILAWTTMCFFSLSVITRIGTRLIPVRVHGTDDVVIALSSVGGGEPIQVVPLKEADRATQVFGIAQTTAIYLSASNGLGRHIESLTDHAYDRFAKAYYASDILFVITIYLAKISLVLFIIRLTPSQKILHLCYSFIIALTLWVLATTLLLGFQCPLARPWEFLPRTSGKCSVDIAALYYSIGAVDILTDLIIIATPVVVVWDVRISRSQRFTVIGVFSCRLATCICAALLLSSIPGLVSSSDPSWKVVTPQAWKQSVQCLSIITACIPCMRPFLASLESGFMDSSMEGLISRTYGGHSGQDSDRRRSPGSLALTSFAAGGRKAIIIPRTTGVAKGSEQHEVKKSVNRNGHLQSLLSSNSVVEPAPGLALSPNGSSSIYSPPLAKSTSQMSLMAKKSVRSRPGAESPVVGHQTQASRGTDSTKLLTSCCSDGPNKHLAATSLDEGCIRQTRDIVVSIDHENSHKVVGGGCW
jgi:hypothetical protein